MVKKIDKQKECKHIGTHDGKFHADEVMATAILKQIYDVEVVRTRNEKVLKGLDIVYDVGGGELDHHDINKRYRKNNVPYAACGLVWDRFGRVVIKERCPELNDDEVGSVFSYIDRALVEGIDAADNGVKTTETIIPTLNISSLISMFNPPWDSNEPEDEAFNNAVDFAEKILTNDIEQRFGIIRARDIVTEAYEKRPLHQVMILNSFCPWGESLKGIDRDGEILFVIYPVKEGYIIHTVRKGDGGFDSRKDLPLSWAGKRDEELGKTIGIDDAIFCHPGRFIAGARSYESIMKMAHIAVNERPEGLFTIALRFLKKLS